MKETKKGVQGIHSTEKVRTSEPPELIHSTNSFHVFFLYFRLSFLFLFLPGLETVETAALDFK